MRRYSLGNPFVPAGVMIDACSTGIDSSATEHILYAKVYDWDRAMTDDFLGERRINLAEAFLDGEWSQPLLDTTWNLKDPGRLVNVRID